MIEPQTFATISRLLISARGKRAARRRVQRGSRREELRERGEKSSMTEIRLVGTIAHSHFVRELVISRGRRRICAAKWMNERSAQVRIISQPDSTAPDLTALTPFPALMTHRAAQLGFRANGTKSSTRESAESGINPYVGGHAAYGSRFSDQPPQFSAQWSIQASNEDERFVAIARHALQRKVERT